MTTPRIERLQEQIRAKAATLVIRDLADPRLGIVTITRVKLSSDLGACKIYWSTLDEGSARSNTEHALQSARGYIQREIAGMIHTRKAPVVELIFDESIGGAARIQDLIKKARADDDARHPADAPPAPEETPPAAP